MHWLSNEAARRLHTQSMPGHWNATMDRPPMPCPVCRRDVLYMSGFNIDDVLPSVWGLDSEEEDDLAEDDVDN